MGGGLFDFCLWLWGRRACFIFIFCRLFRWFYFGELPFSPAILNSYPFSILNKAPSSFISSSEVISLGFWFSFNFYISNFISFSCPLRLWIAVCICFLSISDCCQAEYSYCSFCVRAVFSAKRLLFIGTKSASLGVHGRNCAIIQQYPGNP
jgi:hypothetical protein